MPIIFSCECGKKLQVRDDLAGKKVKCPGCQKVLAVPAESAPAAAAPKPAAPRPAAPKPAAPKPAAPPAKPIAKAPAPEPKAPVKPAAKPASPIKPKPTPPVDDDDPGFLFDDAPAAPAPAGKKPVKAMAPPLEEEEEVAFSHPKKGAKPGKPAKKKGKGGNAWLVLVLLLLLLGGGGAAGWYFFLRPKDHFPPIVKNTNPPVIPDDNNTANPDDKSKGTGTNDKNPIVTPPDKTKPAVPAENPELTEIPAGAISLVSFRIGDWWNGPSGKILQKMPEVQKGLAMMDQMIGMTPADIDRIQAAIFPPDLEGGPPVPGVFAIVVAKKNFDMEKIGKFLRQDGEEMERDGKKIFLQNDPAAPAVVLSGPNWAVFVDRGNLEKYLEKKLPFGSAGVLKDAQQQSKTHHLVLAASIPPELAEKSAEMVPPAVAKQVEPLKDLKWVLLTAQDSDKFKIDAKLQFGEESKAQEVKMTLEGLLAFAGVALGQMAGDPAKVDTPEKKQTLEKAQQILSKIQVKTEGPQFQIEAPLPFNLGELIDLGMKTFAGQLKGSAERTELMNNYRQVGIAFHAYADAMKKFPPPKVGAGLSWRVALLPYLEQNDLFQEFKLDEPWDSEHNIKLVEKMPAVYRMAGAPAQAGQTVMQIFVGPNTPWEKPDAEPTIRNFPDGLSNTILFVEAGKGVPWTKPEDVAIAPDMPLPRLGQVDPTGFLAVFGDASIRFLNADQVDEKKLRLLIDPKDGNPVDLD